jgi:PAS domain S-box-containing protein
VTWKDLKPDGTLFEPDETPMLRALNGKPTKSMEIKILRADGTTRWALISGAPIYGKNGNLIAGLIVFPDITENKQAERILAESETRLLEAQMVSHTGSWDLDLVTQAMWASEEAHYIYGLDLTPELHLPLPVVKGLAEQEYRLLLDQSLKDLIRYGEQKPYDVEFFIRRNNDGERRALHSIARLVRDEQGRPARVAGTIQDITERKLVEEEILHLNLELEQRVRERTTELETAYKELESFSYSVSHDLRGPLRTLDGFSAILLSDCYDQLDDQGRDYLSRIQEASRRMGQLINDMLDLSRITRAEFTRRQVDLSALAQNTLAELIAQVPERLVEFDIADNMIVKGDSNLIRIALENLLNNALKFSNQNK